MGKGARERRKRHEESATVYFGSIADLATTHAPRVASVLQREDRTRATMMFHLMSRAHLPLQALEELTSFIDSLVEWADTSKLSPQRQFANRIRTDMQSGIDAMLRLHMAEVLDPCRDLMEVTVLLSDFWHEPQRLAKWLRSSEDVRRREYGFGKLLHKAPEEHLVGLGSDRDKVMSEYTAHSRTLHPAPPTIVEYELARTPVELEEGQDPALWLMFTANEIARHTQFAAIQLFAWLCETASDFEPEDFPLPETDGPLDQLSRANHALTDGTEAEKAIARYSDLYRPTRRGAKAVPSDRSPLGLEPDVESEVSSKE